MKIAIIHDDLMRRGGAEQVALALHKTFPKAPIFTLCYQPELTYPEFRGAKVITSGFQILARNESVMKKLFYPLGYWFMKRLKVEGFDVVILSSTYASKYASISPKSKIINYCHNPFRIAWYPESYSLYGNQSAIGKSLFDMVIKNLRSIDYWATKKANITIANSKLVSKRIRDIYGIDSDTVINPPVNLSKFEPDIKKKGDNYLVVSRFEPYKKVDLVIESFNNSGRKLTIVGDGSQKEKLRSIAHNNIIFKQGLNSEELAIEYASARALLFPQVEDFGITPLEANASGTPVIAFGYGGVLETMVPYPEEDATCVFFYEQTVNSINIAIEKFEKLEGSFSQKALIKNASRFSLDRFSNEIKRIVDNMIDFEEL